MELDPQILLSYDLLLRIILQVMLLFASAFFSGSEVALFSLSQADLNQLRRKRHPQAASLYALLDQPRKLIISILCGNEIINIAAAANMAAILLTLFDEATAGLLNVLIMVPMLLLFGEVTPKTVAITDPVRISTKIVARPMTVWLKFVAPVRWLVRLVADRITSAVVGGSISSTNILQADEVRTLVRDLQETGELTPDERVLVDTLLESSVIEVAAAMTPRTRMAFVEQQQPLSAARDAMVTYRQQRIPVYAGHRDNLMGFVYAEDLMALTLAGENLDDHAMSDLLQPVVVIPPTKRLDETLEYFQDHQRLAAIVVNEFGGVEGMITVQDLVQFIFSPLYVQDADQESYTTASGAYVVPGDMKLTEFNKLTNFGLVDPRMTTIAGVIFRHLDRLPQVGDEVVIENVRFSVLEMEGHRIASIAATRKPSGSASERETVSTEQEVP